MLPQRKKIVTLSQGPRTSIIMPVYNTAERVVSSIRSVLEQTDPDFELLVMIDASPDDSSRVIHEFLRNHPDERVRVFDNTTNVGVSGVRNQALDEAKGRWVSFIDSDDRYRPNFLSTMHSFAASEEADLVVCSHTLVSTDGSHRDRSIGAPGGRSGKEAGLELLKDNLTPYVWDKLISVESIGEIRFPMDIHRAEDAVFCLGAYAGSKRVAVIDPSLYEYTVDANSATWGKVVSVEESDRLLDHMSQEAGSLLDTSEGLRAFKISCILTYLNNAQQAIGLDNERGREIISQCRRRISWNQIITALRIKPVFGMAGVLLKASPTIYRRLYGMYVRRMYGI